MDDLLLQQLEDGSRRLDAKILAMKIGMEVDLIQLRTRTPVLTRFKREQSKNRIKVCFGNLSSAAEAAALSFINLGSQLTTKLYTNK